MRGLQRKRHPFAACSRVRPEQVGRGADGKGVRTHRSIARSAALAWIVLGPGAVGIARGEDAASLHVRAAASIASEDWESADGWLRAILRESPDDAEAAGALRAIYEQSSVEIPVDEEALERAQRELGEGFALSKTKHFVILSDCGAEWTASRSALLERTYKQFERTMTRMGLEAVPPSTRMLCVLIRDHEQYASFAKRHDGVSAEWVGGYYAGSSNRVVFYDDITGPAFEQALEELAEYDDLAHESRDQALNDRRDAHASVLNERADRILAFTRTERARLELEATRTSTAKTIHEATHLIAYNCGLQDRRRLYPFWFSEGLAASFETEDSTQSFGPDRRSESRDLEWDAIVEQGRVVPMDLLVTLTDVPGEDQRLAEAMYAQSYALFSYLYRYKREALAAYVRAVGAEPSGRVPPTRLLELFEAHFGSAGALERRLSRR